MHILVVHAMVILLTLGPPRGEHLGRGGGTAPSVLQRMGWGVLSLPVQRLLGEYTAAPTRSDHRWAG